MTVLRKERTERAEGKPFQVTWLIDAPWAHPIWKQYLVVLYDLTTPAPKAPTIYQEGVTHEFMLFAIKPTTRFEGKAPFADTNITTLMPANHAYQFESEGGDVEAEARIDKLMGWIAQKRISPDTDWRAVWDKEFADGHTLITSAFIYSG